MPLTFILGKILYVAGSSYCINTEAGPYTGRVLDPATGTETSFTTADDFFVQVQLNLQMAIFLLVVEQSYMIQMSITAVEHGMEQIVHMSLTLLEPFLVAQ